MFFTPLSTNTLIKTNLSWRGSRQACHFRIEENLAAIIIWEWIANSQFSNFDTKCETPTTLEIQRGQIGHHVGYKRLAEKQHDILDCAILMAVGEHVGDNVNTVSCNDKCTMTNIIWLIRVAFGRWSSCKYILLPLSGLHYSWTVCRNIQAHHINYL